MEKKYVVYVLTSSFEPMNYRYVGITSKTLCKRLYYHLYNSKKLNTYKDKWIQKNINNGYQILINSIREKLSEKEAKLLEIEYIRFYKEKGYKLTNATEGGDGCVGLSEEAKLKISLKNKGRKTMQGFKHSEETKEKIRKTRLNTNHSEETKEKIRLAGLNKIQTLKTKQKISKTLSGMNKGIIPWHATEKAIEKNKKIVLQFDLLDNLIKEWPSLTEPSIFYKIHKSNISSVCRNKSKTAAGFKWKYK